MIPVFDGHNDFVMRLWAEPQRRQEIWQGQDGGRGHIDLPRMQKGGMFGGFFAIFSPSPVDASLGDKSRAMDNPPYRLPLPKALPYEDALPMAMSMLGHLHWLERSGTFAICRTTAQIRAAQATGKIAGIVHLEGAEAILPDLDALYLWHDLGLRSLGPVWSRPTLFGHGVPFAYPADPDIGEGLTEAGKNLVRACDKLKIMLDISHLNAKGIDDMARISSQPLVATHCNAHSVTPSSRNLSDRQLHQIAESGGMVGLNFASFFLRPDGKAATDVPWEPILRHLDHLLSILGEEGVGFGSDFDGAPIPDTIKDAAGLQNLTDAMARHGYGDALIRKIAAENWLSLFERIQGA